MIFAFCAAAGMSFQNYMMKHIPAAAPKISVSCSGFRSMLDETVKSLSGEDDRKYILDENYLDEKAISEYIQTVYETIAENITLENIKSLFWNIFIPVQKDRVVSLIEKDNKTLVLESENIDTMNINGECRRMRTICPNCFLMQRITVCSEISYFILPLNI